MTLFIPPPSAGNPIWANDNIWLDILRVGGAQHTGEAEGSPPPSTLDNLIGVTVDRQDHGTDPNVVVQAFVSNPSVGVGVSNGNLVSAGGSSGLRGFPLTTSFATPQAVHIDWYPTDTEVVINGGHICIAANVYDGSGDGAPLTAGAFNLSDPHMAQRNIHIVLAPSQTPAPMSLPFGFYVPEAELMATGEKEILLRVEPVPRERVLTPVIREQLLASSTVTLLGGKPTPEADVPGICLKEPRERIRLRGGGELVLAMGKVPIHPANSPAPEVVLVNQEQPKGSKAPLRIVPRPGRPLPVTAQFKISPEAKPGGVHEFDIVQEGDGKIAGGLRVVILTDAG